MEEKIKIIDEITKRHPANGVEKGWSYYVGGMKDSGDWYFRKMLDVPIEELKAFLDYLIEEENKPEPVYTEQELADMKIYHALPNGGFISEYAKKIFESFAEERERKLLGL
jgi:hypothetical protein